jgi:hypothetical protein
MSLGHDVFAEAGCNWYLRYALYQKNVKSSVRIKSPFPVFCSHLILLLFWINGLNFVAYVLMPLFDR